MLNKGPLYLGKEVANKKTPSSAVLKNSKSLSEIIIISTITILIYVIPWIFQTYTEENYEITKNLILLLGISVLVIVWGINIINRKKLVLYKTPIDIAIILILIISLLSTVFSINFETSLWGYHMRITDGLISSILIFVIFYLIVNTVKTKKHIFFLLKNILFSISSIGLFTILKSLGLFQNIFSEIAKRDSKFEFLNNGLFSPTGNTNSLPFFFILAIPLAFSLYINKKNAKNLDIVIGITTSFLLLGAITITTLSLTPTYFRIITWVIVLVFLIFNVIYSTKINKGSLEKIFISICLFLFAVFAFGVTSDNNISSKIAEKINFSRYYDMPFNTSWDVISGSYNKYSIKSFFIGTGMDTYVYVFPQTRPETQNLQPNWFENYTRSNTQIESVLVNTGILGLLGVIVLAYMLINFLFKKIFIKDNWMNNRTIFGMGIFIIIFLLSYFIIFHSIAFSFIIWVMLGLFFKLYIMLSGDLEENRFEANFRIINNKDSAKSINIAPYIFSALAIFLGLIVIVITISNFIAEKYYQDAVSLSANSMFDEAYDKLVSAVGINDKRDYYHREMASVALSKLDIIIQNAIKDQQNLTTDQKDNLVISQQYLLNLINTEINKAISLNPNNYENWQRAALIYKKLTELSGGTQFGGDTLKAIEESININPTNPDNYLLLGYIYQFNSDDKLKTYAESAYLKAYSLQPTYALSIVQLGSYFESSSRYSEALQLYTIAKTNVYTSDSAVNIYLTGKITEMEKKINEMPTPTP